MSTIFLSLDPGGSQTKIIYQLPNDEKPKYLLMSPEIEEITEENLNRYLSRESSMSKPAPHRQAYLKINQQTFVIGHFATLFDPSDRLKEIKYENAIYKTLAAVGCVIEQNKITYKKISLHLAILLPWNEYSDRKRMHEKLKIYFKKFFFRGKSYSVKLDKFICRPEGGGLVAIHEKKKGTEWLQQKRLGILMCGHRNITALNFEYGELTGDSPLIGFANFLDNVIDRTSGLDRNRIASAIFQGLKTESAEQTQKYREEKYAKYNFSPFWSNLESIKKLANAKDSELRKLEINDIHNAIETSRQEYRDIVLKWLDKVFVEDLDEVIISGGASRFLKPDLERYFNCGYKYKKEYGHHHSYIRTGGYKELDNQKHFTSIVWGADFTSEISDILELSGKREITNSLEYRLVDAYGLLDLLISKYQSNSQKTSTKVATAS